MATAKKTAPKKTAVKAAHKPVAKKTVAHKEEVAKVVIEAPVIVAEALTKPTIAAGRYVFATGRRKTAVANVRLFSGHGKTVVNKKPLDTYFFHGNFQTTAVKPLQITGLANDFHFIASVNGGGTNAQAHAVSHGVSRALASLGDDIRKVLKSNGLLTRDDRVKERKKPGLKRARRAPQWAKR